MPLAPAKTYFRRHGRKAGRGQFQKEPARRNLILAVPQVSKYFAGLKNRFLLAKCITMGALSFPTPFFIFFFFLGVNAGEISFGNRFFLIAILLLSGAMVGLASFYKDSAIAALKDWYPSEKS